MIDQSAAAHAMAAPFFNPMPGLDPNMVAAIYQQSGCWGNMMSFGGSPPGSGKATKGVGKGKGKAPKEKDDEVPKPTEELVNELERKINIKIGQIASMKENVDKGDMTQEDYETEKNAREAEINDIEERLVPLNKEL